MSNEIKSYLASGDRIMVNGGVFELVAPQGKFPYLKDTVKKHSGVDLRIGKHEFTCNRLASGVVLTTFKELRLEILEGYVNNIGEDEITLSVDLISHIQRNCPEGTLKNIRQGKWVWGFIPNWEFSIH